MSERRHYPRTLDCAAVVIELLAVPGHPEMVGAAYECHTADISEGGVRLAGYASLPVGSEALLLITTADGEQLQVRGRISWQLQVATPAGAIVYTVVKVE